MASSILPLKIDLALPFSATTKIEICSSSSSSKSIPITQSLSLSFAPRTRSHNLPSQRILLNLHSSKSRSGRRASRTVVRASQNKTGEQEHQETSKTEEKPCLESKNKIVNPVWPRGERFKQEFLRKIVPWEEITITFDNFPHLIDDETKSILVECVASHVKQNKLFRKYCSDLKHSGSKILLQSIPGMDLFRERLVSALARELQVPLLKLDSSVLPPYDVSQHTKYSTEVESEDERWVYDWDKYDRDKDQSSDVVDSDDKEGDTFAKRKGVSPLKKGDRVIYVGYATYIREVSNRILPRGNRGEVYEVNGEKVAVLFNDCGLERTKEEKEEKKNTEKTRQIVTWLDAKYVKHANNALLHDCFIAMEFLYEVLESGQPVIVYFPDSFFSKISKAPYYDHLPFVHKAKQIFDKLSGSVVLICGKNTRSVGSEEIEKFPDSMKQYIKKLEEARIEDYQINELFTNQVCIKPPKDEGWDAFIRQIEEDRTRLIAQGNLGEMHQVLRAHKVLCRDLEQANTTDMILKRKEVEKIVSWAINHHLSSCSNPCVKDDLLHIPHESLKLAISRFRKHQEPRSSSKKPRIENLAENIYEIRLCSAVVCSEEIGVKLDDVGALEHVKKALYEAVLHPMQRPELFSHGNLLKPCKGLLLFGPPGTGKTLMAKAIATESGANFINITAATITSMWLGETENLTKAIFTLARKLAPVIIFIDEVDSMLGDRDGKREYSTSRLNEFMAGWDGLNSKDSHRILVMGATNRPFDLDDAVLRRMPRRIYVGLPDVKSRSKILEVLLNKENLESGFSIEELAKATEGYSGSDLKNLCVAAAYRPIEELLEQESKGEVPHGVPRPLNLNDFIHSKAKVRPSVSSDASSIKRLREWNSLYGEREIETPEDEKARLRYLMEFPL